MKTKNRKPSRSEARFRKLSNLFIFACGFIVASQIFMSNRINRVLSWMETKVITAETLGLPKPPSMTIDITFKNFDRLATARNQALERGSLAFSDNTFVAAKVSTADGQETSVRLRLKGDRLVHISRDNGWSFRVKAKGEGTVLGMKYFSLQKPDTRNGLYEWLYHRLMKKEGLAALRYGFVQLTVNGVDWGVYAYEEHFGKRLVESNERREGPILRFPDGATLGSPLSMLDWYSSPPQVYHDERWTEPGRVEIRDRAVSLLTEFQRGTKSVGEVFDIDAMAKYFALSDCLGALHGTLWKSVKFYYNPVTSRIEPVAFDGHIFEYQPLPVTSPELGHNQHATWPGVAYYGFYERLFAAEESRDFVAAYVRHLERFSAEGYLERLYADLAEEAAINLDYLRREYGMDYQPEFVDGGLFRKSVVEKHIGHARMLLESHTYFSFLSAYVDSRRRALDCYSYHCLPIEIVGFRRGGRDVLMDSPVLLPSRRSGDLARRISMGIPDQILGGEGDVDVLFRILGSKKVQPKEAYLYPSTADLEGVPDRVAIDRVAGLDREEGGFVWRAGDWTVDRNVIVPAGGRLRFEAGCRISLLKDASIFSRSPLTMAGSESDPVILQALGDSRSGMYVDAGETESNLTHVHFVRLGVPKAGAANITGVVTFHGGRVNLNHVLNEDARGEDGLNFVRSIVDARHIRITGCQSDAVDFDFCEGSMIESHFDNIGNDALDFSGSTFRVSGIRVNGAGDKGLSIGEASTVSGGGLEILDCTIGVAVKDSSKGVMRDIKVDGAKVGMTVFRKKTEFTGGFLNAKNSELANCEHQYILEKDSHLTLNDVERDPNAEGVRDRFYRD